LFDILRFAVFWGSARRVALVLWEVCSGSAGKSTCPPYYLPGLRGNAGKSTCPPYYLPGLRRNAGKRTCPPYPLNGHLPEAQEEPWVEGQAPLVHGVRFLAPMWAAKTDNWRSIFFEPHSGQAGLAEKLGTSSSAWFWHWLQMYS